jgi:hypothetical protein
MEKSKLEPKPHAILPGENSVEIWYQGEFIGTVTGADGPGVRVMTKHRMDIVRSGLGETIDVIEVRIEVGA